MEKRGKGAMAQPLSQEQLAFFKIFGFLVRKSVLISDEVPGQRDEISLGAARPGMAGEKEPEGACDTNDAE